jgi:transposase
MAVGTNRTIKKLRMLSPEWFGYHAKHWTVALLKNQLRQNTGEDYSPYTMRRRLHQLGYTLTKKLTPRLPENR